MSDRDMFDLGLQADLAMLRQSVAERRRILKMGLLGIGVLMAGCADTNAPTSTTVPAAPTTGTTDAVASTAVPATGSASAACVDEIPGETAGPYPADGSNASNQQLNALALDGIVRQDLSTSLGTKNTTEGVPLTIEITLVNTNVDCAPLANHAVYLWHCTREGDYSMYSESITDEDYLRGVQASDSNGVLSFTTIFPGCYLGRWPHAHFEIYPSLEQATSSSNAIHTSQLALPEDACTTVYASDGYSQSVSNLKQITLASDNVFGDGSELQIATVTGDAASGYVAKLTVGVAV
ncbi:MAG: intradiol ring-cleavage dioxygenase [Roseiflexaceae bacterium]